MPRPPRLDYKGARHHVMNRGARHEPIFVNDQTCALFLGGLAELPLRFGVRVHGYALMPNHYHLMLETPEGNLSRAMRHFQATFSRDFNRLHPGFDGPLFRGRFHNRLVDDEDWWTHLLAYIHLNPVEAHLVAKVDDSLWTSHAAYANLAATPDWLTTSELLALHGGREAYRHYLWEVQVGRRPGPEDFDAENFRTRRVSAPVPARLHPPMPALDAHDVLATVCSTVGVKRDQLRRPALGPGGNQARWLAAHWLVYAAHLKHREVADLLEGSVVTVSQWLGKVGEKRQTDAEFRRAFLAIEESLVKLQAGDDS